MLLKYSECHPLNPKIVNEQFLDKENAIQKFEYFPWEELLRIQTQAEDNEIHFSPSIHVENKNGIGIGISIVGELDNYEYYISYKRPITRTITKWFGLKTLDFYDKDFCSLIPEQTKQDGLEAIILLYERNFDELSTRW